MDGHRRGVRKLQTAGLPDCGHWQVLAFQAINGIVVTTPVLRFAWHTPDQLLAGMGFAATMRHYLLTRAYQYAPAPFWHCSAISRSSRRRFLGWLFSGTFEAP